MHQRLGQTGGMRHQGCLGRSSPGHACSIGTEGSHWQGHFLTPGSLFSSGEGAWPKLLCSEDKLNQLKFTGTELTVYNPLGSQAIGAGPPAGTSSFPRAESMNRPGFADCVAESG
jgi:hypothetical protein